MYEFLSFKTSSADKTLDSQFKDSIMLEHKQNKPEILIDKDVKQQVVDSALDRLKARHGISRREMEVIHLIKEGLLYKEIASELNISINTVKTYRSRIFNKCKVQNKIELFKIFVK